MEKHQSQGLKLVCVSIFSLGLIAFSACVASEFKRSKAKDLKLDGKSCHLPKSPAFELGLFACFSLLVAQVIGNIVVIMLTRSTTKWKPRIITLLILSWVSFGIAIMLVAVGTSMNQVQPYGQGWLDGKCYVVKDGVYIGAAVVVLANIGFNLGCILVIIRRRLFGEQSEGEGKFLHSEQEQTEECFKPNTRY